MTNLYSGMLNGLSTVNMSGFGRTRAEQHMRRAAAIVELLLGSRETAVAEAAKAGAPVAQPEQHRKAA